MEFSGVLLVFELPGSSESILRKQHEKVFGIESDFDSFIHDEDVGHILFSAADFILAFEDENTTGAEDTVELFHTVDVKLMKRLLAWVDTESFRDPIIFVIFDQGLPCCGEEWRVEHNAGLRTVVEWKAAAVSLHDIFALRGNIKTECRWFDACILIKISFAEGWIQIDFMFGNMQREDISNDFGLVIRNAFYDIDLPPFCGICLITRPHFSEFGTL